MDKGIGLLILIKKTEVLIMVVVVIVIVVIALISFIGIYNSLVRMRNSVKESFSGIDVQLKKRYDLIPNLVATVKQYTEHENETLTKLTELRSRAMDSSSSAKEKMQANQEISGILSGLNVVVENYPDLKASTNYLQLQRSLNEVEEQLSASRRFYNSAVKQYNDKVMMFPGNIVAGMFNFKQEEMFEIPDSNRENVDVGSLFNK
jgi:LemA protein